MPKAAIPPPRPLSSRTVSYCFGFGAGLGVGLRSWDLRFGLDGHELDFEDQRCVWTDTAASAAACPIGKIRWNEKLPLGSDRHELRALRSNP